MMKIVIEKRVVKFIETLPKKHQNQIKNYILNLQENPFPNDSKKLKNYDPYFRGDSGEYRIIFKVKDDILYIVLVGKRNGDEVYRILKNIV